MKRILLALALTGLTATAIAADAPGLPTTAAPAGAEVYIISPSDGATVGQEVTVRFGLKGMGVAPAGIGKEHTGHHHLLVDVDTLPAAGQPKAALRTVPCRIVSFIMLFIMPTISGRMTRGSAFFGKA